MGGMHECFSYFPHRYGRWLIQSCFGEVCKTNYTTEFQVREYVEPTFDVKISPERSYFHVSDNELRVKIEARYTFGYDVNGRAYVRYGIIEQEKKTPLHWNLIDIENGEGEILILKNKLTTNGTMEHLVGRNIFVQASVMGHSVGELQEAELTSVIILKAKYTLVVQKSSSFFKPNNPYSFQVLVKNPDGSVASGVKVTSVEKEEEKSTKSNKDGIAKFTFNTGKGMRELNIKIYTDEPMQAIAMWKVFPYSSKRDYLLVISPRSLTTKLNEELRLDLKAHLSNEKNDVDAFSYMVISKGSVVKAAKIQSVGFSTAISLLITKEMVPSFRVVGYYHHGGEFVSDSVQIDVETGCDTPLKLSRNMKSQTIPPDVKVPITIEGESKSRVALVAVDKAAYVNNPNNRVTSKQVFAALETFDRTCSPGGGKDAMGVFHDSGLIFAATNGDRSTDKAFQCFEQSRKKKRSLEDYLKFLSDLVEEYKVEQKRRCCSDGQRINLPEETCESRAEFVTEKDDCREIYKKCCKDAYDERYYLEYEEEEEMDVHARNANEFLEKDVYIRNDFPLSFFWETHDLDKNSMIVSRTVPHSITTWELQAISISDNQGICVADPLDIIVFEPLFAKIHLPYSIRRNDQADMRVIVYNYLSLEQRPEGILHKISQSFLLSPGKSFVIPNDMPSDIVPNSDSVSF
uniref:Anaphylatoxin-like domain-containing protein n=1 Tax=Eptatretus burgeri TaxID=7764 RepID=A0A8C4NDE1_EPTBU